MTKRENSSRCLPKHPFWKCWLALLLLLLDGLLYSCDFSWIWGQWNGTPYKDIHRYLSTYSTFRDRIICYHFHFHFATKLFWVILKFLLKSRLIVRADRQAQKHKFMPSNSNNFWIIFHTIKVFLLLWNSSYIHNTLSKDRMRHLTCPTE